MKRSQLIALSLWLMCSQQFTDLASLSALAKYTTGGVYCYPGYDPARDALKLQTEITHNLTRQTGLCGRIFFFQCISFRSMHQHQNDVAGRGAMLRVGSSCMYTISVNRSKGLLEPHFGSA